MSRVGFALIFINKIFQIRITRYGDSSAVIDDETNQITLIKQGHGNKAPVYKVFELNPNGTANIALPTDRSDSSFDVKVSRSNLNRFGITDELSPLQSISQTGEILGSGEIDRIFLSKICGVDRRLAKSKFSHEKVRAPAIDSRFCIFMPSFVADCDSTKQ